MKKLILVFHPNYKNSKNIKQIISGIEKSAKNTEIKIMDEEGVFDVQKEQNTLKQFDVITFAFPFWWYSMPWTLKRYFDEVITPGFGFSFNNDINDFALLGKKFSYIVSVGNTSDTYQNGMVNLHSIQTYLSSLDGLFHLISTASVVRGKKTKQDEYLINPIVMYGTAINKTDSTSTIINKYLKNIDNL